MLIRQDSINFVKSILINLIASFLSVFIFAKLYTLLLNIIKKFDNTIYSNIQAKIVKDNELLLKIIDSNIELSSYSYLAWIALFVSIILIVILYKYHKESFYFELKNSIQELLVCILVYSIVVAYLFKSDYDFVVAGVMIIISIFINVVIRKTYYHFKKES